MATSRVSLDQTQYVRVNFDLNPIIIEAAEGEVKVAVTANQPALTNKAFHRVSDRSRLVIEYPDSNVWVLATTGVQKCVVTEQINIVEVSGRGSSALKTFVQDQTSPLLSVPFLIERSATTLAVDTTVTGTNRTVTLSPGHGALVGDIIELADPAAPSVFMQSQVLDVAGDVITLDQPINSVYSAATSTVILSNDEINVDGSVTPQVYSVLPLPAQSGDMVRVIWEIRDDANMDFSTFGGIGALANGCVLRINNGDGTYKNLFNFKSNGDVIEQCFDHSFLQPKQGNSITGFTARLTWGGQSKHGVVIRLDGALGESLELVVQDDLTGIDRFHLTAQGHEIQD